MKRRKVYLGENEKIIIKCVAIGLIGAASFVLPGLPVVLKPIMESRGEKGFEKLIKKLEKKRFIELGGEKIKLTAKGRKMLQEIRLSEIKIPTPKEWDGIWHLVAYDIPEKYKKSRESLRDFLERNEFYPIQKSLWVHPYECKEEVAVFCRQINILPYVVVMNTDKLPEEEQMVRHFCLDS